MIDKLATRATQKIALIDGDLRAVKAPKNDPVRGKPIKQPPMPEPPGGYPRSYAPTRVADAPRKSPDVLSNPPAKRNTEEYFVPPDPLPGILHIEDCDLDSASDYSIDD